MKNSYAKEIATFLEDVEKIRTVLQISLNLLLKEFMFLLCSSPEVNLKLNVLHLIF